MINLPGDSWDYHLLEKGVQLSASTDGLTCELGVRKGGGTKTIMDAIKKYCPGKVHIAIDPYGSIEYQHKENHFVRLDYTNDMRDECMENLFGYARQNKMPFLFFNMEDTEFFSRFADGVPTYDLYKKINQKYSFVHFDAAHAVQPIIDEINFFLPRINPGACFVFDDVSPVDVYYDHSKVDDYLLENGFKLIETTDKKALYQWS